MIPSFKQDVFLWFGSFEIFKPVYEEFTSGDFNVNFARHDDDDNSGYFKVYPVSKTVPPEMLNKLGFLTQLYLSGMPEWLVVDRDLRRDLKLSFYSVPQFTVRKKNRPRKQLVQAQQRAPSEPFEEWSNIQSAKDDFLYLWECAMRPHFWKLVRPWIPMTDVLHTCACGKRSQLTVCISCQTKYLTAQLKRMKRMWAPYARANKGYLAGSLLPYFFTGDREFLPPLGADRKFYWSPLTEPEDERVSILVQLQKTKHTWLGGDITSINLTTLLRSAVTTKVEYSQIGDNPTSVPVRIHNFLVGECMGCGAEMERHDIGDPDWYNGQVLCDRCMPASQHCIACGRPGSYLGVCLPCLGEDIKPRVKRANEHRLQMAAAMTGNFRIPDQHYNNKGEQLDELEEITYEGKRVCPRCSRAVKYMNRGYCYICAATLNREERKNGQQ